MSEFEISTGGWGSVAAFHMSTDAGDTDFMNIFSAKVIM